MSATGLAVFVVPMAPPPVIAKGDGEVGSRLRIVGIRKDKMKRKATIFWIFGVLQGVVLGSIIFLVFKSLNTISTVKVIGLDTQILLSVLFPLFLLIVEYLIYSKE